MIYVECHSDITLVRYLTSITRREIIHEFKGKGEICNRLRTTSDSIGLIDEDPYSSQPKFITEAALETDFPEHGIRVLRHNSTGNYLVILRPTLEGWILAAAAEVGIDIRQYDLPNNAVRLHSRINISLDKFERLLKDLNVKSARLRTLKRLLESK